MVGLEGLGALKKKKSVTPINCTKVNLLQFILSDMSDILDVAGFGFAAVLMLFLLY
jgi:hypothetical protein